MKPIYNLDREELRAEGEEKYLLAVNLLCEVSLKERERERVRAVTSVHWIQRERERE